MTKHESRTLNYDVMYMRGGNPPIAAGLWRGTDRVAWWPAGYEATQENMAKVMELVDARGTDELPVKREEIRKILKDMHEEEPK